MKKKVFSEISKIYEALFKEWAGENESVQGCWKR